MALLGAAKVCPMLGVDPQCQPTPPMVAVNVWRHATHHPTPVTSAPIPLTSSQRGTRTHGPQVTQHDLQALPMPCVCWTVCGQCLCDPLCLLRWFTPHSKQCHPLGCIASRHQGSRAGMGQPVHPRIHTHAHAHGVARDAHPYPIPEMCLQGLLVLQPAHVQSQARTLQ